MAANRSVNVSLDFGANVGLKIFAVASSSDICSSSRKAFVSSKDRKGLLLAGADRALRELTSVFKDDPIEGPLSEAGMSIWAKIQFEE